MEFDAFRNEYDSFDGWMSWVTTESKGTIEPAETEHQHTPPDLVWAGPWKPVARTVAPDGAVRVLWRRPWVSSWSAVTPLK